MEQLKQLRKERGLTQVKLAVQADIDPSTYNQIENGVREPTLGTLRKLADALDVSLAELLEESETLKARRRSLSEPSLFYDVRAEERPKTADVTQRFDDVLEVTGWLDEYLYAAGMQRVCIERLEDGSVELRGYRT